MGEGKQPLTGIMWWVLLRISSYGKASGSRILVKSYAPTWASPFFYGFDSTIMRQSMDDAEIHYAKSKQDRDSQTLSKFKYDEWIYWQHSFITYLTSKNSITPPASTSLYYVVRTEPCPIATPEKSPSDEIIYNVSHNGRAFETYNK